MIVRQNVSVHSSTVPLGRQNDGFTLVELIISIMLVGILGAVGSSMISDSFTTARIVNAGNANASNARYALERLARQIREVKYYASSGTAGNYCISTWTASKMVFTQDSSHTANACGTGDVTVTINYGSPNLTLQISPGATSTLSSNVASFTLSYLNAANATATDNTNGTNGIRFVMITLTITDSTNGQTISERTRVALRNS
jgi:prepilin-type N-terminal cleavage/methylation domain-containing protein